MAFSTEGFVNWLDRIVAPLAVPNLPILLVVGQAVVYLACLANPLLSEQLLLNWNNVFQGEVWRLLTFVLVAPAGPPIFAIFYFYLLYMMGNFLESAWGSVRFCSFVYLGLLLLVVVGLLTRDEMISGNYVYATIFLAFATLNPNFEFLIMFILPVKVKYLAWLQAAFYLLTFTFGGFGEKIMVAAALGNYLIFFADTLLGRSAGFHRRLKQQTKTAGVQAMGKPRHVCTTCGIDSNSHRDMDFRYCSKCDGDHAYCEEHLKNHVHVVAVNQDD